jgi:hypothetical protein
VKFDTKKYETIGGPPKPVEPPINPLRDPKKNWGMYFPLIFILKLKNRISETKITVIPIHLLIISAFKFFNKISPTGANSKLVITNNNISFH